MSKAYIMLGRIACGKSYIGGKLAEEKGGVILSCDELIQAVFEGCLGDKLVSTEARAIDYLLSLARQIGQNGANVIIDCGLFSAQLRSAVNAKLKLMGFETHRILVRSSDEVRHARLNRRNLQRAGGKAKAYILPWEKVLEIEANRYEEPKPGEYDEVIEND